VLGVLAGLFIVLGGCASLCLGGGVSDYATSLNIPSLSRFAVALPFPIALVSIIFCGCDLFTGDVLYMFYGWLHCRVSIRQFLRCLVISWCSNFFGCILFICVFAWPSMIFANDPFYTFTLKVAYKKVQLSFGSALCSGIGANIFVCLAIWLQFVVKGLFRLTHIS